MTFIALDSGVCAKEREAILVIFYLLDGRVPAPDRMALRTVGAKFATMNICVTVGAVLADVCENRLNVALCTANLFVHPAQRIGSLVMVELHVAADGPPAVGRVAVFARDGEGAVGATRAFSLPVSRQYE